MNTIVVTDEASSVPAVVARVGGALEEVSKNIVDYVGVPVSKRVLRTLARFVQKHPDLNNQTDVELLVGLIAIHGISMMSELGRLIEEYGVAVVALAVDYLYEAGERNRAVDPAINSASKMIYNGPPAKDGMDSVELLAEIVQALPAEAGMSNITTPEELDGIVERLGDVSTFLAMSAHEIAQRLIEESQGEFDHS